MKKLYEIVEDKTDFKVGGHILQDGRKLYAIVDLDKMQGARMIGYYSKFVSWRKFGYLKELDLNSL